MISLSNQIEIKTNVSNMNRYHVSISSKLNDPDWDEFVEMSNNGFHVQASYWAQFKKTNGYDVVRIIAKVEEEIVGGMQILLHKLVRSGNIGYLTKGPILDDAADQQLINLLFKALLQTVKECRLICLVIQPGKNNHIFESKLREYAIKSVSLSTAPRATVLVDLSKTNKELLASMRKKTRQNIRVSLRSGIKVREGTGADLNSFYSLYEAGSKRNNFIPFRKKYLLDLWNILDSKQMIKLFIAEYEGKDISALIVVLFRDTIYACLSGWSGQYANLQPNDALEWNAILWAKSNGFKFYDLCGIEIEAARARLKGDPIPEHLKRSATFYKLGFGEKIQIFPQNYVYISNPLLCDLFKLFESNIISKKILERVMRKFRTKIRNKFAVDINHT
jgi:lipid II:glycine glycyltransferase (peptidoglycan interpeptide bridge formation enzyme)